MIIHADGPMIGYWCETCKMVFPSETWVNHWEEEPSHQIVPVQPITAVHALRCVEHRAVGRYNTAASSEGGECAACAVDEAKRLWGNGQRINDRCPSCGNMTLFVSPTGWLTCSWLACKSPCLSRTIEGVWAERDAALFELKVTDQILAGRNRLLALFECKAHGAGCVPDAIAQVEDLRKRLAMDMHWADEVERLRLLVHANKDAITQLESDTARIPEDYVRLILENDSLRAEVKRLKQTDPCCPVCHGALPGGDAGREGCVTPGDGTAYSPNLHPQHPPGPAPKSGPSVSSATAQTPTVQPKRRAVRRGTSAR